MAERPLQIVPESRDRALPYEAEAEICTLGACVIDRDAVVTVAALLEPEHFHREAHRRVFKAILAISERGEPADPVTLAAELDSRGQLEQCGGAVFVAELLDAVPTAANVEYHAKLVRDAARRRQLIAAGTEIVRNAYDPDGVPVSVLVDRAEQLVAGCAEQAKGEARRAKDEIWPIFERVEQLQKNPGQLAGLSWGLDAVDVATAGLNKGDLVVVAARPSMGKTAFVTGTALSVAIAQTTPVAIFSLEMSRRQIVQRMLCSEGLVDISRLMRGTLHEDDYGRLAQASGHINGAPLWIDDDGSLSIAEMRAKLRRIAQIEPELGLVVVDYIQLMRGTRAENRTQEVSSISRGLKGLAKEFDVPLIALSQLSRAPEQRANHRPQLSDLRESGSIEQDADVVCFLFRPEYYMTAEEVQEKNAAGKAELIISKQRNGDTGSVELYFRKECARFETPTVKPNWGNR